MRLFLASEAKFSIDHLKDYLGGFEGKSLAYIPTASNGGNEFGAWKTESSTWQLLNTLGMHIKAVQLEDYKGKSVLPDLENKDVIWFAGGICGYLMYWVRRTQLDKHLSKLLERSVYVGSSAGSMIASPTIQISEWYPGDLEYGAGVIPGLGLIDFDIFPHYEEEILPLIKQNYNGKKLYLLKNGEEIIVEDQKIMVNGEERIFTR